MRLATRTRTTRTRSSVVATDKAGLTGMEDVEIVEVTNVSEDGTVTLSPDQPAIGRPVTAMLDEPDTEVSGLRVAVAEFAIPALMTDFDEHRGCHRV